MRTKLFAALVGLCLGTCVFAQSLRPLGDTELAQVSGGDGISFAMHLALNDPALVGAVTDSRLFIGTNMDGQTNYIVIKNLRGLIDIFAVGLDVKKKPDGSDYVSIALPGFVKYTNYGFDSLSVQTDPLGPVTESLGRFNVNGTLSMQGQFRFWAH